ncbi:MAG: N-acetylmuramoyl-L-alanine amidase [Pseudomonadota bacterium]
MCGDEVACSLAQRPSPNHGDRRGAKVDLIILHYTAMESAEAAAARLTDPATEVSAHYLIARDGQLMALVPEERRAWHAGRSGWGSITDINSHSIGIELDNAGAAEHPAPAFAEPQMARLESLIDQIRGRHAIPPERILGHACVAPGRKQDPGEKFDWRRLALEGRAVWLDPDPSAQALALGTGDARLFGAAARRIGYVFPEEGPGWSAPLRAVWAAFAQRFLPMRARDPLPGPAAVAHAEALAARFPVMHEGDAQI